MADFLRKYGEATTIKWKLYEVDGIDFRIDAVAATGDIKISKDEGAEVNTTNLFVDEGQTISFALTATEMEAARITIPIVDITATKVWLDTSVEIETYGDPSAQHAFDLDTASVAQSEDNDTKISLIPTTAMRGTDSAATSTKQDTMETTLNAIPTTAMRGTDSAATSAKQDTMETTLNAIPTTAMRGTDGVDTATMRGTDGVDTATMRGTDSAATSTKQDTMETTLNAIPTTAMRGTDGANTVVPDAAGVAPTVAEILAGGDIDGFSLEESLKLILSSAAGVLAGAATNTTTIEAADGSKIRITATTDVDGNRSVVIYDVTG